MENAPNVYGFRYRFGGRNWALTVDADTEQEAKARVAAMASAEFLTELDVAQHEMWNLDARNPHAQTLATAFAPVT